MSIIKSNLFPLRTGLFDDFFTKDLAQFALQNSSSTNTTIPAVNIKETPERFEVEMAAPGMNKEDFHIELDGDRLTITSEKQKQEEQKQEHFYSKREFSYQSFQRTFQLSKDVVDADQIEDHYDNGVLHLLIPKKEEAKQRPPRTIHVI